MIKCGAAVLAASLARAGWEARTTSHRPCTTVDHTRSAVAQIGGRAIAEGLLPQYRTLETNGASIRVARALGFCQYATSLAVRLRRLA